MTTKNDCFLTPAQIEFIKTLLDDFSLEEWTVELAGKAASQRYFIRVSQELRSCILIVWDSSDPDWDRFLTIAGKLRKQVSFLPQIYGCDPEHGLILEEDLGDLTLKRYCKENISDSRQTVTLYKNVLDALKQWHNLDFSPCASVIYNRMDQEMFLWETAYFARYCVQDYFGCEYLLDKRWEQERRLLSQIASSLPPVFIHRDFQSENIIIQENEIRFVDFQGARLGPAYYDIASLLFDPYVESLDNNVADELVYWYSEQSGNANNDKRDFLVCASQRLMQALGAYGNLCLHKGRQWYREYIPVALQRLSSVLDQLDEFKHIKRVVEACEETLLMNSK
ncbi:MAG TPA: phosphotransferase [Chitinispirillaceae bacterium]|nr:phosphotransferase [Chitinispirillaceae bacterium]